MVTFYPDETVSNNFAVTSVFALKDGEWKIVHGHHSTPKLN
ncbi:MAG: nuclear transport factor 2 family protein [Candidatus Hodarchaeota archaeon]